MTAVIYARYSSDNQREESIEGQIRECTAYAEKNGITIVKHYIDRAISAKTDNRPQFQQMIKDSDKKLFDIVLVWKLDRFARNRYDSARYKTQLKKNGVKLMSATEIISEGPEGIILESVLEGYAEYYSADLAEKVVRGQTENILKGRCNGGRGTFGYTLDSERKFHIDPLASPFVLESFRKYRDGLTMKEIRDWLNENGIKNPVGGAFTYNSVEHILNAIQPGILTSSTKERLKQLEETKRELEARIAEEKLAKPKVTEEFIRFWLLRFRKLDMSLKDQRQALVDMFINAIYLYNDKVLIIFNYKEGTITTKRTSPCLPRWASRPSVPPSTGPASSPTAGKRNPMRRVWSSTTACSTAARSTASSRWSPSAITSCPMLWWKSTTAGLPGN